MVRTAWFVALLLYFVLDLSVAGIPGAFVFEADQSVESVRSGCAPALIAPCPPPRGPSSIPVPTLSAKERVVSRDVVLTRPTIRFQPPARHDLAPPSSEDPH